MKVEWKECREVYVFKLLESNIRIDLTIFWLLMVPYTELLNWKAEVWTQTLPAAQMQTSDFEWSQFDLNNWHHT